MQGYTVMENAVIDRLLTTFGVELTPDTCKSGDMDSILDNMFTGDKQYGCLVEFAGGNERTREPFKTPMWAWAIFGIFIIRHTGNDTDTEANMRAIVDRLATMFSDDHRLGGVTPLARFSEINAAEPVTINDTPFYWLPFSIEVIDR